jgi:hypothetical protein
VGPTYDGYYIDEGINELTLVFPLNTGPRHFLFHLVSLVINRRTAEEGRTVQKWTATQKKFPTGRRGR